MDYKRNGDKDHNLHLIHFITFLILITLAPTEDRYQSDDSEQENEEFPVVFNQDKLEPSTSSYFLSLYHLAMELF